jgi:hypothetical protein
MQSRLASLFGRRWPPSESVGEDELYVTEWAPPVAAKPTSVEVKLGDLKSRVPRKPHRGLVTNLALDTSSY